MDDMLSPFLHDIAVARVRGKEHNSGTVLAFRRQVDMKQFALFAQKRIWHLDHDPGTVAGFRITTARTAMGQILEDLDPRADDLVGFLPFNINNEADAAAVMFELRIIKTLFGGITVHLM